MKIHAPTLSIAILAAVFACCSVSLYADDADTTEPKVEGILVELEDGEFEEAQSAADHDGFTGEGFADFFRMKDAWVESPVTIDKAGAYSIVIRFANGSFEPRPLKILVNGKVVVERQEFPGTDDEIWDLYRTITIDNIPFKAGENKIKFVSIDEDGPNLDSVTIVTKPAPTKTDDKDKSAEK